MDPITDAALARRLVENALGGTPALTEAQFDDLLALALTLADDGVTVTYPVPGLQRAASLGCQWKASLTADKYDLGGGSGKTLDESQWFDHWMRLSGAYATGAMHVTGATSARGGIGSIRTITGAKGVPA